MDDQEVDESLWDSPEKQKIPTDLRDLKSSHFLRQGPSQADTQHYVDEQSRDASLRKELEDVRRVNEAIETVILNLEKAKGNMKAVNTTVVAASDLLNTWTRILSQTEHSQRLILDPSWQGASQDIEDIENEVLIKQRAAERRETEEQERKSAAARRAEEEEHRRAEAASRTPKPAIRTTSRTTGRASVSSSTRGSNTSGISTTSRGSSSSRRPASGIARGNVRGARGRAT